MDPSICSHFKSFAQTALVASSEEAFLAGWDACRRHYDGLPAPTATTTAALAQYLYDAYPRHIGRGHAIKAIEKAMVKYSEQYLQY